MIKAVKDEDEDDSPNPRAQHSDDDCSSRSNSKSPKNNYQTCQTAMNIAGIGGRSPTASSQLNKKHYSAANTTPNAKIGSTNINLAPDDDDVNYQCHNTTTQKQKLRINEQRKPPLR